MTAHPQPPAVALTTDGSGPDPMGPTRVHFSKPVGAARFAAGAGRHGQGT